MSDPNCLFCKIAERKIESALLYEDDRAVAFRDINPKAPVHILVVPREHIDSLAACGDNHRELLGHLLLAAKKLAKQEGLTGDGFRVVLNTGTHGGQTVQHIHLHLLGGRAFGWPPG